MTTLAISSGRSRRRIGIIAVVASAKPGMASDGRSSGGSIAPGQTQLTRMSRPAALVSHHPVPVYLLLVDPAGAVEGRGGLGSVHQAEGATLGQRWRGHYLKSTVKVKPPHYREGERGWEPKGQIVADLSRLM